MDTLVVILISFLTGILGGLLGAAFYQKNQRRADIQRWDDFLQSADVDAKKLYDASNKSD